MSEKTPQTEQPGVPPGAAEAEDGRVATGDRREEVHFEADPDQLVKASHLVKPAGPLPPQEQSPAEERGELPAGSAVEDVRAAPQGPSVWDARPPPDDATGSGEPTGH
ncbi:MAG: hypothetical protein JWQ97_786 [Phenylobacterium sp.]|nr:hypothetical protein [Phenylobacterium sp.]